MTRLVLRLLFAHTVLVTALVTALALLFAGCGGEDPLRTGAASAIQPPPESRDRETPSRRAELVATGGQSFQGSPRYHCVLHDDSGVQINLRTGDAGLPVVAVRLDDYQGTGSYRARVFVTGRNGAGALVRSLGVAELELSASEPTGPAQAVLLSGSFEGTYGGAAGQGKVQGHFSGCSYRQIRGGPAILADSNN